MDRKPIIIIGIGNILMHDEGIGVCTVERLAQMALPDYLEVLDGGTSGCNLVDHVADREAVIVIDAADSGDAPGTITWCAAAELVAAVETPLSLHEFGLLETLKMAQALGCAPRQTLVLGVQPELLSLGLGLSDTVQGVIPRLIEIALAEAARIAAALRSDVQPAVHDRTVDAARQGAVLPLGSGPARLRGAAEQPAEMATAKLARTAGGPALGVAATDDPAGRR